MKYFKDNAGDIHAFEDDGSQDHLIKKSMVRMSVTAVEMHINPQLTLSQAAAKQAASINAACAALIVGGFTSSALGAAHSYDSKMEDQLNLIGAASAAIAMPYTCIDAAGVKAEVPHTASQIKKVFDDGLAFKSTQLSKARTLKAQLDVLVANAATTQADIDLVVWV